MRTLSIGVADSYDLSISNCTTAPSRGVQIQLTISPIDGLTFSTLPAIKHNYPDAAAEASIFERKQYCI
jgi:hypothetical protein